MTPHACELDGPDILTQHEPGFEDPPDLDPERLVSIDETWASTDMACRHGHCLCVGRRRVGIPHGHWKTKTFAGALTKRGFIAPWVLTGAINRDAFETCIEKMLLPEQRPGDLVTIDNLSSQKGASGREIIETAGAELRCLTSYSPDFSPIEKAFSKLKALLRKAAERSIFGRWDAIARNLDLILQQECRNDFTAPGKDPI